MRTDDWLIAARAEAERHLQPQRPMRRLWRRLVLTLLVRVILALALAVFGGWAVIVIADAAHEWLCAEDFQP